MRRIIAQTRKELTQIVRDYRTLALALGASPGLADAARIGDRSHRYDVPIVVQDLDNTPASRALVDAFRASITFHVVAWPADRQPQDAFTSNDARAALIIPANLSARSRAA